MSAVLVIFSCVALAATIAERLAPARPQPLFREGLWVDVVYTAVNVALRAVFTGSLAVAIGGTGAGLLHDSGGGLVADAPLAVQIVAVVLILDFCFYWMHRAKHRFNWWWRLHETHHSSRELDWFSSVRFHPLEKILDRVIYLAPLAVLGASESALAALAGIDACIAALAHSNLNVRIGPLIYLFVGPEMHRWHHSTDPAMQRMNFGNNLSIFDWIFGTAIVPDAAPSEFGTGDPAYPQRNWLGQVAYAFRPVPTLESPDLGPAA